jgi:hypothetical protein
LKISFNDGGIFLLFLRESESLNIIKNPKEAAEGMSKKFEELDE